jgi:methyl-accepting chemotaxis protein
VVAKKKILHKIALIGLVPIATLVVFAWTVIAPRVTLLQNARQWQDSVHTIQAYSGVIHTLQIERGTSVVHLKGGNPWSKVETVRQDTDRQLAAFETALNDIVPEEEIREQMLGQLDVVSKLRNMVDRKNQAGPVFNDYTNLVLGLIDRQKEISDQDAGLGVGKRLTSMVIMEMAKENSGRLRAILSSNLAADKPLQSDQVAKLAGEVESLKTGLYSPGLVLTEKDQADLARLLVSPEWVEANEAYMTVLGKSTEGGYGYDGDQMFSTMTVFVNQLSGILRSQQDAVVDFSGSLISASLRDLVLWSVLLVLSIAIATGLLIFFANSITKSLYAALKFSQKIADGDLTKRMVPRNNDESGQLLVALNGMADALESKAKTAEQIAGKDLTARVDLASEKDTLGKSLQGMVDALRDLIGQARESSSRVSVGSSEIAMASSSLSQGATEQAATLQEISASMTEISGRTKENADNAVSAKELADTARLSSDSGIAMMEELLAAMGEINDSSRQIGNIIQTVDDIAFQTNLLALNAAVEAARAGQHGKGFAVVAEEVRSLAGRSAKAARETSQLVESSYLKVTRGSELADSTAEAFREIATGVAKAANLVGDIAVATNEQSQGIGEISEGLRQTDDAVQLTTAAAEELAASSESLSYDSSSLEAHLNEFRTGDAKNSPALDPEFSEPVEAAPEYEWSAV